MGHLHGGFHIPERIGSHHSPKECHVQCDRAALRSLYRLLQLLCLQCLDLFQGWTILELFINSFRHRLDIFRRIEHNLCGVAAILILCAVFVAKSADFGEYSVNILLTDSHLLQLLCHQLGQLTGSNAQMFRSDGLREQRRTPPAPLQALAGHTAPGRSAKHTGLGSARLIPVQIDRGIVFQHMDLV